ncbi:hypothetical protein FHETE_4706 [Fusarium heterosporum]|uniref:Uncharacterized protein n=1 Tax=Fusarium heterosporum TaxID=42747 RepID=A0A8H5WTS5_FUSHE|nr:hypothetical protein FHETE_4706 [Fusarium heterosporum]
MPRPRVKDIPLITQLRVTLGYGVTGDRKSIYFNQTVANFRKDYRSADGIPGFYFADWHNRDHRRELERMADKFLVTDRRGPQFWPDIEDPRSRSSLTWTTHRNRIRNTIVKLFFRLNYKPQRQGGRSADASSRRSQTLEQGLKVPETRTENTDGNGIRDVQNDQQTDTEAPPPRAAIPDLHSLPSSPFPSLDHPTSSDSDDIPEEQHQSLVSEPTGVGESAAPVAQMTEGRDMPLTPSTLGAIISTHTLSGRRRRPVERQDFVTTPDFCALDDARSQLSPELGTPSEDPDAIQPTYGPIDTELPRSSIETAISPEEAPEDRRAMPPPPLPFPRPTQIAATSTTRTVIKYSIQKSPNNFRVLDLPRGAFDRLSISDIQAIEGFQDVESVQFVLDRRGMSWDDVVPINGDLAFQDMKGRFREKIRDDLDEIGSQRDVVYYDILIIPIKGTEAHRQDIREPTVTM